MLVLGDRMSEVVIEGIFMGHGVPDVNEIGKTLSPYRVVC